MIREQTKILIKGYLEGFIQGMIDEKSSSDFDPKSLRPKRELSSKGDLKPFHESLLPDGLMTIAEFERSFSTKLGSSFEECARLIACDNHKNVSRQYKVEGYVSSTTLEKIDYFLADIEKNGFKSSFNTIVSEIRMSNRSANNQSEYRSTIADLSFVDDNGYKILLEIKSPKPNKGQCLEATRRLLLMQAIESRASYNSKTYFCTAYNPWGKDKSFYKHSFALKYLDLSHETLIGKEFWELIGGIGTYENLLEIYQDIGREKGPEMLEKLALGY